MIQLIVADFFDFTFLVVVTVAIALFGAHLPAPPLWYIGEILIWESFNLLLVVPVVIGLMMYFKIFNIFWKILVMVCSTTRTAKTSRPQQ